MTDQPTPPESSSQSEQKLKTLIIQGIVGAIALAGTTAIPLIVTQILQRPTTPVAAPSVAPITEVAPVASPVTQSEGLVPATETVEQSDDEKNKPKKKN